MQTTNKLAVYKALADETRYSIVSRLAAQNCSEACASMRADIPLSQPAMSHHLSKLVAAGIIREHKEGTAKAYELNRELLAECGIDATKL